MGHDYSKADIVAALRKAGIKKGDSIFVHSNIGFFGRLQGAGTPSEYYGIFKEAIFEVIGNGGTLVVPTFTYSFFNKQPYDPEKTPSKMGIFCEAVRLDPQSLRSDDPNFSVAAIGAKADLLTRNAPEHSFGSDSFWERFLAVGGKICNFNFDAASTMVHYVEKKLGVSYRYDKAFSGTIIKGGKAVEKIARHFVYDLAKPGNEAAFSKFDALAKKSGAAKAVNLGRGSIVVISAADTERIVREGLKGNPALLIKADKVE